MDASESGKCCGCIGLRCGIIFFAVIAWIQFVMATLLFILLIAAGSVAASVGGGSAGAIMMVIGAIVLIIVAIPTVIYTRFFCQETDAKRLNMLPICNIFFVVGSLLNAINQF